MLLEPEKRDFPKPYIEKALTIFRERQLKSIVEIGCIRQTIDHPLNELNINCCMDGHSTIFWATETNSFITVDIDPACVKMAIHECNRVVHKSINAVTMDGIKFLETHNQAIDFLSPGTCL